MPNLPSTDLSKAGLYFNFAFYGAGRDAATGWFKSSKKIDSLMPTYAAEVLTSAGPNFKRRIAQRFAEKHGRTGATARSMREDMRRRGDAFLYSVYLGGGIGFVINPIGGHTITVKKAPTLANSMNGPWEGRYQNFYSAFAPYYEGTNLMTVDWRQGGRESFSPDKSWYEDDKELYAETYQDMAAVASKIAIIWGGAPKEYLDLPIKTPYYNPYNPNADY